MGKWDTSMFIKLFLQSLSPESGLIVPSVCQFVCGWCVLFC